jgi:hypothetical protein
VIARFADAVAAFVDGLDERQRDAACLPFEAEDERRTWFST